MVTPARVTVTPNKPYSVSRTGQVYRSHCDGFHGPGEGGEGLSKTCITSPQKVVARHRAATAVAIRRTPRVLLRGTGFASLMAKERRGLSNGKW